MNCSFCLEKAPLHARYVENQWTLACMLCDVRDDEREPALDVRVAFIVNK
jgi:hypothetical protein